MVLMRDVDDDDESEGEDEDFQPKEDVDSDGEGQSSDDEADGDDKPDKPEKKKGKEKAARPEKRKRSAFIDEEAEHSDEEELDDDEEGEEEGDVMGEMLARGEDLLPDQVAARQNQALDADRRKREEAELEKQVKQRYESGAAASRYAEDGDDEEESHRFKHLPDAQRDPKLWLIKCKPNQEKRIIIALMQKFLDAKESGTPLSISSALCTDIKGYVYIEAFRESHVRTATQGLNDLYYRVEQVPTKEMTDVLRVRQQQKDPLTRGSWVRMRRNDEYRDDLAQVTEIVDDGARARVRLIPRLRIFTRQSNTQGRAVRPPAKLFNPEELRRLGEDCAGYRTHTGGEGYQYDGNLFEDGCLVKTVAVRGLRHGPEITPTLPELERFKAGLGKGQDLLSAASLKETKQRYIVGDLVQVTDGDLKGLLGHITDMRTDGSSCTILPKHSHLTDELEISTDLLAKSFKLGDHVKVIGGTQHLGETGMIMAIDGADQGSLKESQRTVLTSDTIVHVFCDLSRNEIEVRAGNLQECADVSVGLERLGDYELYDMVDLVALNGSNVGVVIKVEHSSFKLLTTSNAIESIEMARMGRKRSSRGRVALDMNNSRIELESPVKVMEGPFKGRNGLVKHVFKSFVFVHCAEIRANAGLCCARSRECQLQSNAAKPTVHGELDIGGTAAESQNIGNTFVPQSPSQLKGDGLSGIMPPPPAFGGGGGFGGGGAMDGGRGKGGFDGGRGKGGRGKGGKGKGGKGGDPLVGQLVSVTTGAFKGHTGLVKSVSNDGNSARVELQGVQKIISVKREGLMLKGGQGRSTGRGGGAMGYRDGGATPGYNAGGRTPTHFGACATPLRNDGFRTPMHGADDFSRTPLHGGLGNQTPLHGSRTPLHGSQTPLHGSQTPGSHTPSHDGSRTPAHQTSVWDPTAPNTPLHRPMTPSYTDSFENQWASMGCGGGSSSEPSFGTGGYGGADSSFAAAPPAAAAAAASGKSDTQLLLEHVVVSVVGGDAAGGRGTIVEISPDDSYQVQLEGGAKRTRVTRAQLEVVRPAKKDKVLIVRGEHKGTRGVLIGIDGQDGIVKMQNSDIKILDLDLVAKYDDL